MNKKRQIKISDNRDPQKIKKIYTDEFNARVDLFVKRSLELPTSFIANAPFTNLGEATECFIHGFFNASIALSRTTLEQALKHKLSLNEAEIISLECLIKLGTSQELLTKELRSEAMKIQKWGNAYMHGTKRKDIQYKQQKDRSKEVLLSLKKIIEAFYPQT